MVTCRRMWTKPEEDVLGQSLKEIIATGWKADNGFSNGTGAEDFQDALNGVLHNESQPQTPLGPNESQPQTPLGPNLEDMDTTYTPGVEKVGTTSFCQLGSSSTSKQPKKGKRKKDDGVIGPIMEGVNKFTDKTDSR
ncbi:hypothetical protein BUALT_Bualt12G0125500 [Buddleja alternifolia]|uniref:Uncharacterized protein n=1 Tax=Buddleja alternifolia TaxID=168488 RepID=A0AAV6X198_9LAMI|nr:hypothetical protein BUALT_Bualt12G0125500 [Buddleja alternifolia]